MKSNKKIALLVGNSDGIGMATTKELLKHGWKVIGISRSKSPIIDEFYQHKVTNVENDEYIKILQSALEENKPLDLCIYCAGIGELLDPLNMQNEEKIFKVNLLGLVKTVSTIIPIMVQRGKGHFIGLSSVADEMLSVEAPSYHASKAGFSSYLEGLALALKPKGVAISNVRFGFVNTKMAKGKKKPFMMEVEEAVAHLMKCIELKPMRYTIPKIVIPLVNLRRWILRSKIK